MSTIAEIAAAYEKATNEYLIIANNVPESKLDVCVGQDWSSRQVIHHCADSEAQSYARLRRLIAEPGTQIQGYDEGAWAKNPTLGYTDMPVETSIAVFAAVRAGSLAIIKRLEPEQLKNFCIHSEAGEFTVERWLQAYTRHAIEHADQITKNLAL
jgi:hypothetical protein